MLCGLLENIPNHGEDFQLGRDQLMYVKRVSAEPAQLKTLRTSSSIPGQCAGFLLATWGLTFSQTAKDPSIGGGRADEQPWSAKSPVRVFGATKSLTELGSHVWHSRHYMLPPLTPTS